MQNAGDNYTPRYRSSLQCAATTKPSIHFLFSMEASLNERVENCQHDFVLEVSGFTYAFIMQ